MSSSGKPAARIRYVGFEMAVSANQQISWFSCSIPEISREFTFTLKMLILFCKYLLSLTEYIFN